MAPNITGQGRHRSVHLNARILCSTARKLIICDAVCRRLANRCGFALFGSVKFLFSMTGLVSVAAGSVFGSAVKFGPGQALQVGTLSAAGISVIAFFHSFFTIPAGDINSQSFVDKLSGSDKSLWSSMLQLTQTFDECDVPCVITRVRR
jgi:hypothetical protein